MVFETLFGRRFPTAYPRWLRSAAGHQMELDGYCRALGLAFEHQGEQHYRMTAKFYRSERELVRRKAEDARKRRLCRTNGVTHLESRPSTSDLGRRKAV